MNKTYKSYLHTCLYLKLSQMQGQYLAYLGRNIMCYVHVYTIFFAFLRMWTIPSFLFHHATCI